MNLKKILQSVIFESKWLLVIFYIGLILAQLFYAFKFCGEVWHMVSTFSTSKESDFMLIVLSLIDIVMVANLIKMIISGSYQNFIEKVESDHTEQISSGGLKVKMGSSLIGISSIHLLQSFINSASQSDRELIVKCSIHIIFLISTIGLAFVDYLHQTGHKHEKH